MILYIYGSKKISFLYEKKKQIYKKHPKHSVGEWFISSEI